MNKKEYITATKRMEALINILTDKGRLSKRQQSELDLISENIADYEELNFPFKPENLKEMIELRMYQRKLKQKDVAKLLGTTPSRVSEILNGKRQLTLEIAKGLYRKLNIDAEMILNEAP
jgi:HTH-type transcriptional regulator/antitoxin HigA